MLVANLRCHEQEREADKSSYSMIEDALQVNSATPDPDSIAEGEEMVVTEHTGTEEHELEIIDDARSNNTGSIRL